METMEINEFNQEKLRLLDTEQLLAFYGIFGTLNSPRAKEMVAGISRELKRRNYTLDEEIDVKALLKGLGKGAMVAGKTLKTVIKVTYPIAKDMVKGTWIISKKIGGAIGDLMDDSEFRKLFTKYIDNPEDPNRLKKIQAYTDNMLSDAPVSGMESVKMKKLRIEKVCSIVLGEDYNKDFIYEDVDFTKPSAIKEAYEVFEEYTSDKEVNKMIKDIAKKAKVTIKLRDNVVSLKSNGDLDTFLVAVKNFNKTSDVPMIAHQIWRAGEGRIKVPAVKLIYNQKIPASMFATYEGNKEFNEAKRMKYDKVIKKLKDGEWDTSMDVKQRMHLIYTDNNTGRKKTVFVESADLEEATFYKPKVNRESETITFVNDAEAKQAEKLFTSMKLKVKRSGKRISFINTAEFKSAKSKVMAESTDLEEAKIPRSNISKFSSPQAAKRAASKQKYKTQIFMGDDGKFWVPSTNKEAGQLKKDGYEVYESPDLEEAKNATVRELRQMLFKIDSSAADKFRRELFNIDKQDSPATNAQIKKAKKIIGNRFGKDAFVQLEAKSDKQQDIESLEKMIKNPDPRRFSQYGGKDKYLKMLNSKLAKLKA